MKPTKSTASFSWLSKGAAVPAVPKQVVGRSLLLPSRSAGRLRRDLLLKSSFDRCLSLLLLFLTLPIIVLSMVLVKLTSRGPALYSQKRVGQFGQVFIIWKIRTMYHECEKLTGPRWSTPGDPRVTLIGRVLRSLHIDELPQLMNVLRGQMSLIGPRPERPEIAGKLKKVLEGYDERLLVLPGISGNAQLHLPPDTMISDVRDKLVLDRDYIRRLSILIDLKMLFLTALKSLKIYSCYVKKE